MSNDILQEIGCPDCGHSIDVRTHGREVSCTACGGNFLLHDHLCYRCYNYHPDGAVLCSACGAALNRICATCSARNWAGDELCLRCGTPLDFTDILERQQPGNTSSRLTRQMAFSRQIKEEEEAASQRRMAELMAIEEARQAELLARRQKQQRHDRLLLLVGTMITAALLLLLTAYLLLG